MDLAIRKQKNTAGLIERFWDNLAKSGKDKLTKPFLSARLQLLETYWTRFMEGHDGLLAYEDIDKSDYMVDDRFGVTEDNYITTKARISGYLTPARSDSSDADADSVLKQIQLPKINLPTFNGDPLTWEKFRDLFKALVHDVAGITPIQKLQYLSASITGEAAAVIAKVEMSSTGYSTAWEELNSMYDNRRVLLAAHMRTLLSADPITKPSKAEINRLIGVVNQAARSFKSLGRPVEHWDDWFVHILVDKLDSASCLLWESSLSSSQEFPTFNQLKEFLLTRARALDAANPRTIATIDASSKSKRGNKDELLSHTTAMDVRDNRLSCTLCRDRHTLRSCAKFKALSTQQRREQVRKSRACFNCLSQGHRSSLCPSKSRCRKCGDSHHTLLHLESFTGSSTQTSAAATPEPSASMEIPASSGETSKVIALSTSTSSLVLLATARVTLLSESGRSISVRALLDSGSEATFVSERVAQYLRASRRRVNVTVSGLQGVTTGRVTHAISVLVSTERTPSLRIAVPRALVMARLTALTPGKQPRRAPWTHLQDLELADPEFDRPAAVDAVLGADVYGMLLTGGVRRGQPGEPVAHSTIFGWVLMGSLSDDSVSDRVASHHVSALTDLQEDLHRFWELEDLPAAKRLTPDEELCERLFVEGHSRDPSGRYTVRLPRKQLPARLGDSRRGALHVLLRTERQLQRDPQLKARYAEFLAVYSALGHMEQVPRQKLTAGETYYMPHHAVVKATDPDGKIRVVFNASFRTSSGASLNDTLLAGPKLQADLWLVLSRWRLHQFAFTTDIIKMFRQIRVHPDDTDYQRILWRAEPDSEVQDFRLTTVTYGTASAPYLAIRTLLQLTQDEGHRFPLGVAVLRSNTYVDDILAGASTLEEACQVRQQTVDILEAGGFRLSKWASSHPQLCPDGDQADRLFPATQGVGTLGVVWSPTEDLLQLRAVPRLTSTTNPTKRSVLSDVARLFDPAGWAAPVLIKAKVFLQDLWTAGLDWDQPLSSTLGARWLMFAASLPDLNQLRIPRWTGTCSRAELHAFSDASERAYAAAVYVRGTGPSGIWQTSLLVAKTKVAPLKLISIPRLELCGALLAARLIHRAADGLGIAIENLHAWSDAKVVLAWLRSHPSRWKPFVANRVAAIQEKVPPERWRYVSTGENPADLATRSVTPLELRTLRLWWKGPDWLEDGDDSWPTQAFEVHEEHEERRSLVTTEVSSEQRNTLLDRFSSFSRLIRVSAYCLRFLRRAPEAGTDHLSTAELAACLLRWLRIVQQLDFKKEIEALTRGEPLSPRSPLRALRPILGTDGLLRVGGRLERSALAFEEKHPIILAKTSHLSLLLVREAHHRTLHGGPQLTRSILIRRYWIVHANVLIRSVIHHCVRCARFRGITPQQQMGQLPADRVREARPFWSTGVDFAGPVQLRASKGRGIKSTKGYICLFVCMATRAVHLEAVSDLSTASFLAAFRRFVARRGRVARLTSDNGTNFQGAERELRRLFNASTDFYSECRSQLAADGTEWTFNPPSAPHFGGLWEAGIKSTKHHLRRILGDHRLTYEELSTLLCQVEACLNSRPLYPMSNDPTDFSALTPGHLLLGEAPINVPEPPIASSMAVSPGLRWRLISAMRDHFWSRWATEYFLHLQRLGKWRNRAANVEPGTLVLIKNELLPPTKWELARVRDVHPGEDGLVRVVTVDTASARLTRPITKICPLPIVDTA